MEEAWKSFHLRKAAAKPYEIETILLLGFYAAYMHAKLDYSSFSC